MEPRQHLRLRRRQDRHLRGRWRRTDDIRTESRKTSAGSGTEAQVVELGLGNPTPLNVYGAGEFTSGQLFGMAVGNGHLYVGDAVGKEVYVFSVGKPEPELTVVKEGKGSGIVTSSPGGINCGSTCTAEFEEGKKSS